MNNKKILQYTCIIASVFFLGGCFGFSGSKEGSSGGVFKSTDGGKTFEPAITISEKENIASTNVIAMTIDPVDTSHIYIGTKEAGMFETADGAGTWGALDFPLEKIYGIALNPRKSREVFALGVWKGRAKLYRSVDSGKEWNTVYVEPAGGTALTALALSSHGSHDVYIGTSTGVVMRSRDNGASWENVYKARDAILDITFDKSDEDTLYIHERENALLRSRDGGKTFENILEKLDESKNASPRIYTLTSHPSRSGVLYVGTDNGVFSSLDFGSTWTKMNTIGDFEDAPVRAIAINPLRPDQISYATARAVYTSANVSNKQWIVADISPGVIVDEIHYDPFDPATIYAGTRRE